RAPAAAPSPAPPTPPRHGPLLSPFTGEPVRALEPVIAVKIDNIVTARPQTGLRSADIVYTLPVEGGLSRFCAVYSSHMPKTIGPVRSAREDDLGLLRQFGRPGFAYSGATPHLLPFVQRARTVDLYASTHPGYRRSSGRVAPENLYANPASLLAQARKGGASDAHDIGFRFSAAPPPGGRRVSSVTARYPAARFTFRWSASAKRWLTSMDGGTARDTAGGQLGGATVVLQYTTVTTSRFLEYGKPPPYADTTGSGRAVVLRDGRSYDVTWTRPSPGHGTVYKLPSGRRMTFAPGQVWVLFLQK
ncbi:MAG: DUF3048 domain-containing protein, partial [Nocardiopsaceae bacterium]|nr:DUF3048 domain-containing protein [Nocardiopsaceae bacterium]